MTPRKALLLVVSLELLIILIGIMMEGFTLEALHSATRFSGRFSLLLFSCIFLLGRDRAKLEALLSPKFYLAFALAHGIHLMELGSYVYLSGTALIPIRVLGGFLAYVFIFAMPVVMNFSDRLSPRRLTIIETVYASYLWLIFFLTYLPRVMGSLPNVGGYYYEFVILMTWVVIMFPLRLIGLNKLASLLKT